jgi:hypothetical protein
MFTDKYKRDSDKYHEFLSEYIVSTQDENDTVSVVSLYSTFRNWHAEAGYGRNIPNRNEFINYIRSNKNYEIENGNFIGVCFKDDWEERQNANKKKTNKQKPKLEKVEEPESEKELELELDSEDETNDFKLDDE